MSGGHAHGLLVHPDGPAHRLPAHVKVVALLAFVGAVVLTPREAVLPYAVHAVLVVAAARAARVPLGFVARRLTVEVPFVAFALVLPFIGRGPHVDLGPLQLSALGLWGAWAVLVKATLGLAASVLLAATTPVADLLRGLEHLRVPRALTAIAGFTVRYADVVTGEMRRMTSARRSRAYDARWLWQAGAVASCAGALFVRCFERGERVHHAMLARGFTGAMPARPAPPASRHEWTSALAAPAVALVVAALSVAGAP